jgi:hypothetical protein
MRRADEESDTDTVLEKSISAPLEWPNQLSCEWID